MKTWAASDPKAALMTRKRAAIVEAALQAFLENGYAQSSMDRIASVAGVSVKTVYRHFAKKDELFSAVMQTACNPDTLNNPQTDDGFDGVLAERPWFSKPPRVALAIAGMDYLRHALSEDQLALYRVVTHDAHRFPELGARYREQVIEERNRLFSAYLARWAALENWKIKDGRRAANAYAALLRADLFDAALHGVGNPTESALKKQVSLAAASMLVQLKAGHF